MNAETEAAGPVFTFKKRVKAAYHRKRPATPPPASDSEEYSSEDDSGQRVKRRRKIGPVVASSNVKKSGTQDISHDMQYAADRSTAIESTNDATKQSNWYDEDKEDDLSAKNLLGKTRAKPRDATGDLEELDGTYKGNAAYGNFIKKNKDAPDRKFGPMKAATNIRTITITDFSPDVCKDYKQTGYCGFGDSCKFLHAREDYKQGWAIDRDWEAQTGGKRQSGTIMSSANKDTLSSKDEDEEDAELLEKIPFACIICKKPYTNPVTTKCGHYFCEKCALQRYRKKPDCAACGAGTGGVFNQARDLKRLLERKKAREERLKKRAEEEAKAAEEE